MDTFLTVLSWATPPIVGALIGYATNKIASKMLFWPLEPKYLVRWRIPLTPGVIPRNREDLAAALAPQWEENCCRRRPSAITWMTQSSAAP